MIKKIASMLNVPLEELQYRMDGRIEWECEHGVGHTVYAPAVKQDGGGMYRNMLHGCCGHGCCSRLPKIDLEVFEGKKNICPSCGNNLSWNNKFGYCSRKCRDDAV